jgi:hypothetical protein
VRFGEQEAEISSESEASSKRMERRGSVMPNLKCTDAQVGGFAQLLTDAHISAMVLILLWPLVGRVDGADGEDAPGVPA